MKISTQGPLNNPLNTRDGKKVLLVCNTNSNGRIWRQIMGPALEQEQVGEDDLELAGIDYVLDESTPREKASF